LLVAFGQLMRRDPKQALSFEGCGEGTLQMSAWFYILRFRSGTLYAGATTNLEQRWRDHQAGQACRTTRLDPAVALVFREQFASFPEARRREAQVKRWSAKKKEALVSGDISRLRLLARSRKS